jgi:vacuolar iron transporter family protein
MSLPPPSDHFRGKSVVEHLKEARTKGMHASHEVHGTEMPGHFAAGADAAKETSIVFLILWTLSLFIPLPVSLWLILWLFAFGMAIWKMGRSALLGWARMERLHRLIEEERWEIQHHRQQERKELAEMYRAKGFEGKLLEEVLDVLMADDNRLLKVMLEEELGLTLEAYEHPLRQSLGALAGVFAAACLCLLGSFAFPLWGLPVCAAIAIGAASIISAKIEKNRIFSSLMWNLAIAGLVAGALYFLTPLLLK